MTDDQRRTTALVTGASSGIGRASALRLAADGFTVVLVGRDETTLRPVQQQCEEAGGRAVVAVADVRDIDAVAAAFDVADAQPGRLGVVVHCAGVLAYGRFEDVPADVFDASIDTTLLGAARVCREALVRFDAREGGRLVLVGSLLGKSTTPGMSSYTTAKWGLHGLARTLQQESQHDHRVQVSLVSPGGVDTPIYRQAGTYLGRHGQPPSPVASADDVARVVMRCLRSPRRDADVGWTNPVIVAGFRLLPGLYDTLVGPLMGRIALQPGEAVAPTTGNVLAARPDPDPGDEDSPEGSRPVRRTVGAPAEQVWTVLADGWTYADWVVGAARIRDVDAGWPAPSRRLHHTVGIGPLRLADVTEAEQVDPGRRLVMRARGWPFGHARVVLTVTPDGADACTVSIAEDVLDGPGRLVPQPVRQVAAAARNTETLRRLAGLAERRSFSPGAERPTPDLSAATSSRGAEETPGDLTADDGPG